MGNKFCKTANGDVIANNGKVMASCMVQGLMAEPDGFSKDGVNLTGDQSLDGQCLFVNYIDPNTRTTFAKNNRNPTMKQLIDAGFYTSSNIPCTMNYSGNTKQMSIDPISPQQLPYTVQLATLNASTDPKEAQQGESLYLIMGGANTYDAYSKGINNYAQNFTFRPTTLTPADTPVKVKYIENFTTQLDYTIVGMCIFIISLFVVFYLFTIFKPNKNKRFKR